MEELGIPAGVIITEPFQVSARSMAVAHGVSDYPFIVIPHPIGNNQESILEQWVEVALDQAIDCLTDRKG